MKMVINKCYGGFSLSHEAILRYAELKGITLYYEDDDLCPSYYTVPVAEAKALREEGEKQKNFSKFNSIYWSPIYEMERNDPHLVQVVEELGKRADGRYAELRIIDIPDGIDYEIEDYDGVESVHELHRTWY